MVIGDILRRNAKVHARKIGLVDGEEEFSYRDLNARVNRLSHVLLGLGLAKGERLAVLAPNCHEFVEAYFAAAKTGLVVVPVNIQLTADEVATLLENAGAVAMIYAATLEDKVSQVRPKLSALRHAVALGSDYEARLAAESEAEPDIAIVPDDRAMIMYTSGTTGNSKGVIATHRNILANTNTMVIELRFTQEDVTLLFMPLFHNGGLNPLMNFFYLGATVILAARFREDQVLALVEAKRVTFLNVVSTMLMRLIALPDFGKYDLSSIRLIMHGGGPIAPELVKKSREVFGVHRFFTTLGSTESNGMITSFLIPPNAPAGFLADKVGSAGRDAIGVEVRIVNEDGVELPRGEVGEIVARGDNISPGYWNLPEETAKTFQDGWLHGGDLGHRDEDGYIFIVGRKKDIIISGGENISAPEVEAAIAAHPGVDEVAVIGVPDQMWGEAVLAVVTARPEFEGQLSEAEIIAFCAGRLAGFKKPKAVRFVDQLPKTALGKISKGELKKLFGATLPAK